MLNRSLNYVGTKIRVKFSGDCLRQEKIAFNHGKMVSIYIVYEIKISVNISSYPAGKLLVWCSQIKKTC